MTEQAQDTLRVDRPAVIDLQRPKVQPSASSDRPVIDKPADPPGGMGKDAMTLGQESRDAAREAQNKEAKPEAKEAEPKPDGEVEHKEDETPAWMKAQISKNKREVREARERADRLEVQLAQALALVEKIVPKQQEAKEPRAEDYQTPEEYEEARVEFRTEQRVKEREAKARQEREQQENAKVMATHEERLEKFAEEHPEVMDFAKDSHSPISAAMGAAIMLSDKGPQVLLYLSENRDEAMKIYAMHPSRAAAEIGKIEDRLDRKPAPAPASKAPAPIKPVGASERTVRDKYEPGITSEEYWAIVDAERAAEVARLIGR